MKRSTIEDILLAITMLAALLYMFVAYGCQKPRNEVLINKTFAQTTPNTCWAASIATIYNHTKGSIKPCQVANEYFDNEKIDCCSDMDYCDMTLLTILTGNLLDDLGIEYFEGTDLPTFEQYMSDIDKGIIYLASMKMSKDSHTVVLYGYDRVLGYVLYLDPWKPQFRPGPAQKYKLPYKVLRHGSTVYSVDGSNLPVFFVVRHFKVY